MLPLDLLEWPDFESLQWRILRDVEGLRDARIYGDPGQTQRGLDLIALAADGSGVALQSKRVKQFGPAKIEAAVDAFRNTTRPFDVSRFIIGVSREVRTTAALERLRSLREALDPVELELWDQRELSTKLKVAPRIVIDYFGEDVARDFCEPFLVGTTYVPAGDAVAVREAIARTPEWTTGAGAMIEEAQSLSTQDPVAALGLVERAQRALDGAGFAGHAAQHEALRSSLLFALGRGTAATRRRLDQLWSALDRGQTSHAGSARGDIRSLIGQHKLTGEKLASQQHLAVADAAFRLYENPLAHLPDLGELLVDDCSDRARLIALAGEIALATDNRDWLRANAGRFGETCDSLPDDAVHETLRVRLQLLEAESSGEWASVLTEARSARLGYSLGGLVQARHARHLALAQQFEQADAAWDEAAASACLAEQWTDAARWTFSRRAFRTRWNPFATDALLPIQTALLARGPDSAVLPRDEEALQFAYSQFVENKLRSALIAAQRALRDAVTLSDWEGERRARRLVADVLDASGEHEEAARHLVLDGSVKRLEKLGEQRSRKFLDVTAHLRDTPYWIAAAAYRLIAVQADLVPDAVIEDVADASLVELDAADKGTLVDLRGFSGSRYLGAVAVLAGTAHRLGIEHAERMLSHFEAQPTIEADQYRYHDADEARAVAGVATAHESLSDRALEHLVALLARSDSGRATKALGVVTGSMDRTRPLLHVLAENGNSWAREVLVTEEPETASDDDIAAAKARLEGQLKMEPGVFTFGSGVGAIADSLLVRTLPVSDQLAALTNQIQRAANINVTATDRASYLLAASNLRAPGTAAQRKKLIDTVVGLVTSPPHYLADAMDAAASHPLGGFRVVGHTDARGEAAHLAATLAQTRLEKERVRTATLGLVSDATVSEFWVTRALQQLGETMAPDVGFLSGLGWALRSLAAILWAKSGTPEPVGIQLANDADARVRRTLATQLLAETADLATTKGPAAARNDAANDERPKILTLLRADPCHSVRTAARGG